MQIIIEISKSKMLSLRPWLRKYFNADKNVDISELILKAANEIASMQAQKEFAEWESKIPDKFFEDLKND